MENFLDLCKRVNNLFDDYDFDDVIFSDGELNDPTLRGLAHSGGHPSDETKFIYLDEDDEEWI